MITTLRIGPMALPTYPLLVIFSYFAGLWLAAKIATRRGLNPDHIYNAGFYAAIAGILAGRMGHIIRFFDAYREDPISLIAPNAAAFYGPAVLIAALAILILYQQRYRIPALPLLDALCTGALAASAVLALADGLNGRHLGSPSMAPWAIVQWSVHRHPVQFYELLGVLALVSVMWTFLPRLQAGQPALAAIGGYAGVRLLVDAFRDQPATIGDGFRLTQVIALLVLMLVLLVLYQQQSRARAQTDIEPSLAENEQP